MNNDLYVPMTDVAILVDLYQQREAFEDFSPIYSEISELIKEKVKSIVDNANSEQMSFNKYQELSKRTMPTDKSYMGKLWILNNYGLGLTGESGEIADLIKKKVHHGHDTISVDDFKNELGDVLHYLAGIATLMGLTLQDVAVSNIQKLKNRYPNGFNTSDSIARKDVQG